MAVVMATGSQSLLALETTTKLRGGREDKSQEGVRWSCLELPGGNHVEAILSGEKATHTRTHTTKTTQSCCGAQANVVGVSILVTLPSE